MEAQTNYLKQITLNSDEYADFFVNCTVKLELQIIIIVNLLF